MKPYRDEIESLEQNGITKVAFKRIDDPKVIPLWFGEGDTVTPDFIREATKQALDDGQTFYSHTRGRPELRHALKAYLDGLYGIDLDERRITVPGAAMLGVTIAAQMALTTGRSWADRRSRLAEHRLSVPYYRRRCFLCSSATHRKRLAAECC